MKKVLFTMSLTILQTLCYAQPDKIRRAYLQARNPEAIQSFLNLTEQLNLYVPSEKIYRGVALAMYADIANGVSNKLNYFNRGKELIEASIYEEPNNPEMRFLRLSVQTEAPFMLGYYSNIEEDLDIVLSGFNAGQLIPSHFFWSAALKFIEKSDEISADYKHRFKKFMS